MRRTSKITASAIAALALLVAGAPVASSAATAGPQQLRRGADDHCKNKPTRKARQQCHAKHGGGKEDGPNHQ
jgi:hypothetical protein